MCRSTSTHVNTKQKKRETTISKAADKTQNQQNIADDQVGEEKRQYEASWKLEASSKCVKLRRALKQRGTTIGLHLYWGDILGWMQMRSRWDNQVGVQGEWKISYQ